MKTITTLQTVRSAFAHSSFYWGDRADWLIAYSTTRDADCLAQSNWAAFIKAMGGTGTEGAKGSRDISEHLAIEEANHWACGWIQRLVIHPDAADLIARAEALLEKLDGYPVLDEDDWSEREYNDYNRMFGEHAQSEFRRYLKDLLSDRALDLIESAPIEKLQTWFESQIPSGEYQIDGYPQFGSAFKSRHSTGLDRDDVAALLRSIRAT